MTFSKNSAENQYLASYDDFVAGLVPDDLVLEIEYESDCVDNDGVFFVKFNSNQIVNVPLVNHSSVLRLNLIPTTGAQTLEIGMTGKKPNSTIVQDGKIVKDTFVKLLDLRINNYKLLDDYKFFFDRTQYVKHENQEKTTPMNGFWQDASLTIEFDLPFDLWYNSVSTKNVILSESLQFRTAKNDLDSLVEELEQSLKKLI